MLEETSSLGPPKDWREAAYLLPLLRKISDVAKRRSVDGDKALQAFISDYLAKTPAKRLKASCPLQGGEPHWQRPGDFQLAYRAMRRISKTARVSEESIIANLPAAYQLRPSKGGKRNGAGRRQFDWAQLTATKVDELGTLPGMDAAQIALRVVIERALYGQSLSEAEVCRRVLTGARLPEGLSIEYVALRLQDRLKGLRAGVFTKRQIKRWEQARVSPASAAGSVSV